MRFVQKYWTTLSLFFLIVLSASVFFGQSTSAVLAQYILIGLVISIIFMAQRNWKTYLQGKITRSVFMRNVILEIFGILLAMTLAGLLGRYIAEVATAQITNDIARFIAGILIGLLAGVCVAILVKRTWGRLLKA